MSKAQHVPRLKLEVSVKDQLRVALLEASKSGLGQHAVLLINKNAVSAQTHTAQPN